MSLWCEAIVLLSVLMTLVCSYPTISGRNKVDPFVALANTLRQEEQGRPQQLLSEEEEKPIDMWQLRQLQQQMNQAAIMMPYFERKRNYEAAQYDDYGVPVLSEEDGQLYHDPEESVYSYKTEQEMNKQERENEEKRLLMDTLLEYMYLSGKDKRSEDEEERGQREIVTAPQQKQQKPRMDLQHITNSSGNGGLSSTNAANEAKDELIQQLDTLKNSKH